MNNSTSKSKKTCIIIAGPTAIGKTSIAIDIAKKYNTSIISADSRQCFKELNIGVARPSEEELNSVQHYFIASHSILENVNAVSFAKYADEKIDSIFQENDFAVMVGGTGLYLKAFKDGLDELPEIPDETRKFIIDQSQIHGIDWLQLELEKRDRLFFEKGEMKNPQRMMRALEVKLATGKSIIHFQQSSKRIHDFNFICINLEMNREKLYHRINQRVDMMIELGLVDEVKSLIEYKYLNALKTVGYEEIFDYLEDKISLEKAIDLIKQHSRNYAKRQITWFKKDPDFELVEAKTATVLAAVDKKIMELIS